jgi:hypothetical protein
MSRLSRCARRMAALAFGVVDADLGLGREELFGVVRVERHEQREDVVLAQLRVDADVLLVDAAQMHFADACPEGVVLHYEVLVLQDEAPVLAAQLPAVFVGYLLQLCAVHDALSFFCFFSSASRSLRRLSRQ